MSEECISGCVKRREPLFPDIDFPALRQLVQLSIMLLFLQRTSLISALFILIIRFISGIPAEEEPEAFLNGICAFHRAWQLLCIKSSCATRCGQAVVSWKQISGKRSLVPPQFVVKTRIITREFEVSCTCSNSQHSVISFFLRALQDPQASCLFDLKRMKMWKFLYNHKICNCLMRYIHCRFIDFEINYSCL